MSTDLHDLFADAYRTAPPSTVDADLVVRRGRRVRARRQAVTGTGALLGVGVVVAGSVAFVATATHDATGTVGTVAGTGPSPSGIDPGFTGTSATPGDPSATPSPTPSDATPVDSPPGLVDSSTSPTPWKSGDPTPVPSATPSSVVVGQDVMPKPTGIDAIALPDPAPGFPARRWDDGVSPGTMSNGVTYYSAFFGLERTSSTPWGGVNGVGASTVDQITIVVGQFPLPPHDPTTVDGNPIVARPQVAGVPGRVTSWTEKGTPMHYLYFTSGPWTVEVFGAGRVTTAELVALGNALTGIR
jgi:hypothetical protein